MENICLGLGDKYLKVTPLSKGSFDIYDVDIVNTPGEAGDLPADDPNLQYILMALIADQMR